MVLYIPEKFQGCNYHILHNKHFDPIGSCHFYYCLYSVFSEIKDVVLQLFLVVVGIGNQHVIRVFFLYYDKSKLNITILHVIMANDQKKLRSFMILACNISENSKTATADMMKKDATRNQY